MLLGKSSAYREILSHDKIQARLVLAGLWLLMLLPLMLILDRAAMEITNGLLCACFLAHSYRTKNWSWLKQPPVLFALILWLYSVAIVTPFAIDPALSARRIDWFRFILLFAAIVYWLSAYHEELRRVAGIILVVLLLAALDGFVQIITHTALTGAPYVGGRMTGPLKHTVIGTYLTKMSLPVIGILIYYAWLERKKYLVASLLVALLFIFTAVLLSGERTALLTFTLALSIVTFGMMFYFKKLRKPIVFLCAVMVTILAISYMSRPLFQYRIQGTHAEIKDFDNSSYAQIWKASLLLWKQHPVTGVGMVNFRIACPKLMEQGKVTFCAEHSHNSYLEVLSEFGTLGMSLLLLFITSLIVLTSERHTSQPRERLVLTFFAFAGLLANFFPLAPTQSLFSNWPAMLAWQSFAWSIAILKRERKLEHD